VTDNQAERLHFAGVMQIGEEFTKIAARLRDNPGDARHLSDRTLLALAAWAEGTEDSAAVAAECRRRHEELVVQERRFAAFGGGQLALIEDLDDDGLWALARKILSARRS